MLVLLVLAAVRALQWYWRGSNHVMTSYHGINFEDLIIVIFLQNISDTVNTIVFSKFRHGIAQELDLCIRRAQPR